MCCHEPGQVYDQVLYLKKVQIRSALMTRSSILNVLPGQYSIATLSTVTGIVTIIIPSLSVMVLPLILEILTHSLNIFLE